MVQAAQSNPGLVLCICVTWGTFPFPPDRRWLLTLLDSQGCCENLYELMGVNLENKVSATEGLLILLLPTGHPRLFLGVAWCWLLVWWSWILYIHIKMRKPRGSLLGPAQVSSGLKRAAPAVIKVALGRDRRRFVSHCTG